MGKIAVINLIGRVFMQQFSDCPFKTMDKVLEQINADVIILDFHAETTSEKQALGWYLKDRVNLILGLIHMYKPMTFDYCLPKQLIYQILECVALMIL